MTLVVLGQRAGGKFPAMAGAVWSETVILAGKMVDAASGDVREAVSIVVDGERIKTAVAIRARKPGAAAASGYRGIGVSG